LAVKIFTFKVCITSSCKNFKDIIINGEEEGIKCITTKVMDDYLEFAILVQIISDSNGSRFTGNMEGLKTSNGTSMVAPLVA